MDELRVRTIATVTLIGEDRDTLGLELVVSSSGFDEAEAKRLAEATEPRLDVSGRIATLSIDYPEQGQQRAALTLRLPNRLHVRVESARTETKVSGVAGVYLDNTRGDVSIDHVAGLVEGGHAGGDVTLADLGEIKLTVRSSDVQLDRAMGDVRLELTGGTLKADVIGGGFEFRGRSAEIEVGGVGGVMRLTTRGGRVVLNGVSHEVRFDGTGTDITLAMAAPAPVTAITSDAGIVWTMPPSGGFTLDAAATGGRVRLADLSVPTRMEDRTEHAAGPVRGGGPIVALRATNGGVEVRTPAKPR